MSRKTNANDYLFGRRETGIMQTKYIQRGAAAFRTLSPNTSSSSDSCDDSFDQIYKPFKKPVVPTTDSDTTTMEQDVNSMVQSSSDRNKFGHEECDELDELFKNIDLKDTTTDNVPREWLEQNEHPVTTDNVGLSTVYEGSESNYRSTKSVNSSTISKDSANFELSADSLINCIKPSENSTDSLDRSYVTSNNVLPIELNDTLEDVEYVCDERNRYLLKPVSKAANTNRTNEPEYVSADSSVILIDSSPDTSFVTASNEPKLIDVKDIKTETLSVKSSLSYCTLTSMDTNRFNSSACTVSSTHLSFTTAKTNFKLIDSDDIKSERSDDKTSTASEAKTNSWSTLDSSANVSTAPMIDDNDSLFIGKTKLKSTECGDDGRSETSGDGQMFTCITYPKTASFFEDDEEKTVDSDAAKSSEYFTAVATNDSTASTNHLSVSAARYNTLDDVPSFSTDSTVSSVCHSNIPQNYSTDSGKHFNDSLDRIEYMMRKGRELQQKTCDRASPVRVANSPAAQYKMPTPKALTTSSQKRTVTGPKTPLIKAKPFVNSAKKPTQPSPHAVTPSTRILKPFNRPQSAKSQPAERKLTPSRASPIVSPAFKKPTFPTSGTKKESAQSRIPTAKNFNHIVSPIGAYIKNIAAPPLLANVKPTSDFFDSSYCNKMSKESLDQSVMSEAGGAGKPVKLVSSLPVKFFTSSQQQRVIDEKFQKIPGGEKLNRIIGQMPSVISHQGRIHSGNPVKRIVPTDDSFADVSVMSGDISVQVVRDVKRQ